MAERRIGELLEETERNPGAKGIEPIVVTKENRNQATNSF